MDNKEKFIFALKATWRKGIDGVFTNYGAATEVYPLLEVLKAADGLASHILETE